jgi:hypothetical protein
MDKFIFTMNRNMLEQRGGGGSGVIQYSADIITARYHGIIKHFTLKNFQLTIYSGPRQPNPQVRIILSQEKKRLDYCLTQPC